jgi:hypothetical protein
MTIFSAINKILLALNDLHHKEVDKFLSQNSSSSVLAVKNDTLVEISEESIILLGADITKRIFPASNSDVNSSIDIDRINNFFTELKDSLIRLNHLGISYSCVSIKNELIEIKKILHGTKFKLYEEPADNDEQRWFFIGNLESWEYPLFELVLTESKSPLCTEWIPHFQIDVDTKLATEELEFLTRKYLKDNFIDWQLDIPGYGIVLEMGKLANINGIKIYLGLGTDKRNAKLHREEILRLV